MASAELAMVDCQLNETILNNTMYNLMTNAPAPDIITPSYVPLHCKHKNWGNPYESSDVCKGPEFIRIYGQNVYGISDRSDIIYDQIFLQMK